VTTGRLANEEQHATLLEKVDYLDKSLADNAERHARELRSVKDTHSKFKQNVEAISNSFEKHGADAAAAHSGISELHGRLSAFESQANVLSDLKKAHGSVSTENANWELRHTSLKERLDFMERMLGEATDKHSQATEAAHVKMDHLHSRLADCERNGAMVGDLKKAHGDLATGKSALESHHALMKERMSSVERLIEGSIEKHAKDIEALKVAHDRHQALAGKHARDLESLKSMGSQHSAIVERIGLLEQTLGEAHDRHLAELAAVSRKADHLQGKINEEKASREKHHGSIRELIVQDKDQMEARHNSVKHRVEFLENVISDNAEKHSKALSETRSLATKLASEVKTAQDSGHRSLAERVSSIERTQDESTTKISKEIRATHSTIDQLYDRLSMVKDAWSCEAPQSPSLPIRSRPSQLFPGMGAGVGENAAAAARGRRNV